MSRVNWERVKDVFAEVLESPRRSRDGMVDARCVDAAEREAVRDLLAAHDRAAEFLEPTGIAMKPPQRDAQGG